MNCTFCGEHLDSLKIKLRFNINVDRYRTDETWEPVSNMRTQSTETLCKHCFDDFTTILNDEMVKRKSKRLEGEK